MKGIRRTFLALVVAMSCMSYQGNAQLIVNIRPARPVYVRSAPPSPRHVWVDEEWREDHGHYAFAGGHWVVRVLCGYPVIGYADLGVGFGDRVTGVIRD